MAQCESCGKRVGLLHRNLIGRTRFCPTCHQAEKKAATDHAANQAAEELRALVESLRAAGLARRLWVGAKNGALIGFVVPLTLVLAVAGNTRADWAVIPGSNRTGRLVLAVIVVVAVGWWLSGMAWGWLALSVWAASSVVGAILGATAGARGRWGWL